MRFAAFRQIAMIATCLLVGCQPRPERIEPVGRMHRSFVDTTRRHYTEDQPRPLSTTVWYPTRPGAKETAWTIGIFQMGSGAVDAPLPTPAIQRPLIVVSHGTGGAAGQLSWLAESLATRGYIVAAVNHHGNTAAESAYLPHGFALWWERPRDLSVVLDRLLAEPMLSPHIDPARIGALGFSLGGYSVLALAGARVDRSAWQRFCKVNATHPNCRLPPESPFNQGDLDRLATEDAVFRASLKRAAGSYADPRIRAVFALAPVLGMALDPDSLRGINVPLVVSVGAHDDQALPADVTRLVDKIPKAKLDVLASVAHYTFLAPCTLRGRWLVRPLCGEPGGADRRAVHRRVAQAARRFFEANLTP